jgi:hypothetical protein
MPVADRGRRWPALADELIASFRFGEVAPSAAHADP